MTTIRSATTAPFAAALLTAVSVGTALAAIPTVTLSAPALTSTSLPDTRTTPGSPGDASARLGIAAIGASVILAFLALGPGRAGRQMAR